MPLSWCWMHVQSSESLGLLTLHSFLGLHFRITFSRTLYPVLYLEHLKLGHVSLQIQGTLILRLLIQSLKSCFQMTPSQVLEVCT